MYVYVYTHIYDHMTLMYNPAVFLINFIGKSKNGLTSIPMFGARFCYFRNVNEMHCVVSPVFCDLIVGHVCAFMCVRLV
jgi:hypothetical protein